MKIVVGGQINKKEIAEFIKQYLQESSEVDVKGDLEAVNAVKKGEYDYYICLLYTSKWIFIALCDLFGDCDFLISPDSV